MSDSKAHYDDDYFAWQSANGLWAGMANKFKFDPYVKQGDAILDFGCGDGSLLVAIGGSDGIEINPAAVAAATKRGIRVFSEVSELQESHYDVIVSNHAIEHVPDPTRVINGIFRALKPGGRAILVVPCDRANTPLNENDQDYHLFSWSAGNLGNLVKCCGFSVEGADEIVHRWPPFAMKIQRAFGWQVFHLVCRVYSLLDGRRRQVRAVGVKR